MAILLMGVALSQEKADPAKEKEAVKQVALDYIEGWYEGNAARMERALHPDLVKRGWVKAPGSDQWTIESVDAKSMIEWTRKGVGKIGPDIREIYVTVYDVYENIATARVESISYIDYLQLVKLDGHWKILNVLWVPNQTKRLPPPNRFQRPEK